QLDLGERRIGFGDGGITNSLHDLAQQETAVGDIAPVRTGKNADMPQVLGIDFHFVPDGIFRHLAPHVPAAAIEQRAANTVLRVVGEIRVEHDGFKFLAIAIIFFLVELILQELGNYFRFSNAALDNHAASFHRKPRMERKNGSETTSSISMICTTITCRKLE